MNKKAMNGWTVRNIDKRTRRLVRGYAIMHRQTTGEALRDLVYLAL